MPLFFIVAGYFYKPNYDYKLKLAKDAKRLLLPYIVTIGFLTIYTVVIHGFLKNDYVQIKYFLLYYIYPGTPVWFLAALFWCRVVGSSIN